MCKAASSLPEDLVREILVRLPLDEPAHLVRASLVCKAWRRVLADRDCFLLRCRGIHGAAPLLGYIQNCYYTGSSMQFVPATSVAASVVRMPADVDYSTCVAVDCRHGRVLIHSEDASRKRGLVVWDPHHRQPAAAERALCWLPVLPIPEQLHGEKMAIIGLQKQRGFSLTGLQTFVASK